MVNIRPAIRAATEADRATIRKMVFAERLDPTSLNWRHFLVAENDGQIVGIGQIRPHRGCLELGSLVVLESHRKQGIAAQLMAALEARAGYPLYLFCEARMREFYARSGYEVIGWQDMPWILRLKRMPTLLFRPFGIRILVMRKDRSDGS